MTPEQALARLRELDRERNLVASAAAVLGWDQETYMPGGAVAYRAEQLGFLAGLAHEKGTNPEIGELLAVLGADDQHPLGTAGLSAADAGYVRKLFRDYRDATRLPRDLVERKTRATARGQHAWQEARKANDFPAFARVLQEIIALTREEADLLGWEANRYDALLDQYEPDAKSAEVAAVFERLQSSLVSLLDRIRGAQPPDARVFGRRFPVAGQTEFGNQVLKDLGYDFNRGRLDVSAHPFTTTLGSDDVRITTRFQEDFFGTGLFGIIHECGHALYEQGVAEELRGTAVGDGTSLGIHESQSRFWENVIGRSPEFWQRYYPDLTAIFPQQLQDIGRDEFFRAINLVQPSLIRVEADEVTYGLHIILRFRLEQQLINNGLPVTDLPEAWNSGMQELLGIRPDRDANGVLQDIHWSAGLIGYFPTYALGNLYAGMFTRAMEQDIPDMREQVAAGQFGAILAWLRDRIHRHGATRTAQELATEITGGGLDGQPFVDYLEAKYAQVYRL